MLLTAVSGVLGADQGERSCDEVHFEGRRTQSKLGIGAEGFGKLSVHESVREPEEGIVLPPGWGLSQS